MGRWSRRLAETFVRQLDIPPGRRWLDVGCGTGALTAAVLAAADPVEVAGVDPSEGFLASARERVPDPRAAFTVADARDLPFPDDRFDVVVSGLVLNFVPDPAAAAAEIKRVTAPGGRAVAYLWDLAQGMEMLRCFWDAAAELDPAAAELHEGRRYPLCRPEPFGRLWTEAGLKQAVVDELTIPTTFRDFDDYWQPFLGRQGPAPAYLAALPEEQQGRIRELLRSRLPANPDGSIPLTARAWVVSGTA
ncbi:methyltransferase, S-adenosyl-L-methionine (SAM)-MTase protein [Amycolatopsis vancoresmycina DSM 44592]|uniref:Methyltransferase, S-adenosyl-L-methionine (SAM)-MTase protein n=2 Tax=Amycolatopsis vancoresmycina TaxID=208444 RepID=R1HZR6_9PSEU|nr:class I SAM-dependent methyltransferase [Amycolatopsis vancoresmycina]EOD63759.1 methyltransferase, S-adenosyl-L-methionine (SAM)-MTase protein [Amycolatopsis vancoresmycina DSM 44592]